MFLNRRSLQAEYFDAHDRPRAEVVSGYAMLAKVNRFFHFAGPYQWYLPRMLGAERCRTLAILDLGAGDGTLAIALKRWAARQGWDWQFTNLDLNVNAMRPHDGSQWVSGSACELPFCDRAFDVVIASQMTHHLISETEITTHFREAWRVTKGALLITDLHRNLPLYWILWGLLHCFGFPPHFRADGLLSVKKSGRVKEWRAWAEWAGIPDAKIWLVRRRAAHASGAAVMVATDFFVWLRLVCENQRNQRQVSATGLILLVSPR